MTPTDPTPLDPDKILTNQRLGTGISAGADDERTIDLLPFTQLARDPEHHQETRREMGR
ncbi:MAG: hypothetical protein M5U23_04600 [Acidimicrobiia bacterium]|nr:hypothetical protein [Acidimicrobiia bacterium]